MFERATWDEFERLKLAVGVVIGVEDFPEARDPAFKLTIDFGPRGTRRSSAKLTHYARETLPGRQVVCVLGFVPKRVAGFKSEVLVLGALSQEHGVVLLRPDRDVEPGGRRLSPSGPARAGTRGSARRPPSSCGASARWRRRSRS